MAGLDSYCNLINERSYLDYSEILTAAVGAITNDDDLRKRLAERVRYVIVDEYQDVNPIQEAIVWSLHELGAKICVVGDDDQTVYQWRGSDVDSILTFAKRYPVVTTIPLEENFRSSDGIVETARDFIAQNAGRLAKAMKPTAAQAYEQGDITALAFPDPDAEAQSIAQTCIASRGLAIRDDGKERGISWSDMAVLLRSVKKDAAPIMQALESGGVPFVVIGMNNLFGTPEAEAARQLFYFMASRPESMRQPSRQHGSMPTLGWTCQRSVKPSRALPRLERRSLTRIRRGGGSTPSNACSSPSSSMPGSERNPFRTIAERLSSTTSGSSAS